MLHTQFAVKTNAMNKKGKHFADDHSSLFSSFLASSSLCSLCLYHLWHQPAHQHMCQPWQPKPRRAAWLSSFDSFRHLHPDSDLYGFCRFVFILCFFCFLFLFCSSSYGYLSRQISSINSGFVLLASSSNNLVTTQ